MKGVSSDVQPLISTLWNQKPVLTDLDGDGQNSYYQTGCTAVAVGQLINFYLKNGYANGWLDIILQNVDVYPTIYTCSKAFGLCGMNKINLKVNNYNGHATLDGYDGDENNKDVQTFLLYTALGLDSKFDKCTQDGKEWKCYTGVSEWSFVESLSYYIENTNSEIASLLTKRFRFVMSNEDMINGNAKKEFIPVEILPIVKQSLNTKQPVLISYNGKKGGGKGFGHAIVLDGYRINNGVAEFHINNGWGPDDCNTKTWRRADEPFYLYYPDKCTSDNIRGYVENITFHFLKPIQ